MSEAVKKETQMPEGYSPKKPEIVSMAAAVADKDKTDKYKVVAANGGKYIDGIPMLRWGEYRDSSCCGCITAALNAMGYNLTYEDVMGLTGVAFQAIMRNDWDPSSQMPQNGLLCEGNVTDVLGISVYSLGDEEEIHRQTQSSIDNGIPVLMVGGRNAPEWTIVCGYETENGQTEYFGRSYFDIQNDAGVTNVISNQPYTLSRDEIFTSNKYYLFNQFPGEYPSALTRFYDRRREPLPLRQALKVSLETCLEMFKQSPGSDHNYGYDAYDVLISGFMLGDEEYKGRCDCDQYHVGSLQDARRAAYIYLERYAGLLSGENQDRLLRVSGLYRMMYEELIAAVPYEKTSPVFNISYVPVWDEATRKGLVAALKTNKEREKQAHESISEILEKWEEMK